MDTITSTLEPREYPSASRHTCARALGSLLQTITVVGVESGAQGLKLTAPPPSRFKLSALPAEANARRVDPATWDSGLPVPIPQVQASSSGAPTQLTPPQDGSSFPPTTTSTPVPKPPLSDPSARMPLVARSTPSPTTTLTLVRRASTSDPSPGAIVAIVAGVTLFFVLVAVLLHLQDMKAFWKNIVARMRRRGLATPAKDRQWDVLSWNEASALASTEASTPEPPFTSTTHTARMRDVSIHLVSTAEHAPLPPLQPNRRPPSSVIDPSSARPPELAPPLPRLEPLRRKPSKSKASRPPALVLPAREPTPPETPPKDPPPLPSPTPSSTSASEKRLEPSSTTMTLTTTKLTIQMPRPVRGDLRPISAYTSASTTLSEMPLLKPSTRPHEGKDARLSRVLTVANPNEVHSPGGAFLPPIPPVPPIPPIYLPKLAAEKEKETPRPLPAKPLGSLASPPTRNKPIPTRGDSQSTALTLSPTSPASLISSPSPALSLAFSSPSPLRRQNSASSTRSPRSPLRKPVPPLVIPLARHSRPTSDADTGTGTGTGTGTEGEDAASSIWAPESGWRKNSLASTALDELAGSRWGSPVPSSSASQMYRTRDSGLSEWTWTRPLEDWEKEQMDLRRKASAGELSPPHTQRSLGGAEEKGGGGRAIRRARVWAR
ncbi:hypothetical protein V8D89_004538 [Ganoderma adspersum]